MRLGTITDAAGPRPAAFVNGDTAVDLIAAAEAAAVDAALFRNGASNGAWLTDAGVALAHDLAVRDGPRLSRRGLRVGPPVPAPRTFIAAGRNYADHLREGQKLWAARGKTVVQASFPTAFVKFASSIVADGEDVRIPPDVEDVDYEIELAVIIGEPAFRVSEENALDHVAGYTICDDIGARKIQRAEMEHQIGIVMAKNFPTFAPMGPWLVTRDEIPDPQALDIKLAVNGEERQHANTADMIFPVAQLVSYWSRLGLRTGDMIITGTPAGVALARPDPAPFYLKPGDRVELTIDRIGTLRHGVAAG